MPVEAVDAQHQVKLSTSLLWTMAIACDIAVANIYYNQPMLTDMARSFHASAGQIGFVATATQAGYAVGMPAFIPLADFVDRRSLLAGLFAAAAASAALLALGTSLPVVIFASFLLGATSVIAQILIPFAAEIARPDQQGHVIGILLSGVLLGILSARTMSGFVAHAMGWRSMFWIAAALSLALSLVLAIGLPRIHAKPAISYTAFMRSIVTLPFEVPALFRVGMRSGMFFAAFIAFWTTLVFLLETPPYHYGSQLAGIFGLVGIVGASVAPLAGKMADRRGPQFVLGTAVAICLAAFLVFQIWGWHLWGLVVGVILLDAGVQAAQVSNQSSAFSLLPKSRNRVNTVYMVCYFGGGTLGSLAGTWAWERAQWTGVCLTAMAFLFVAAALLWYDRRSNPSRLAAEGCADTCKVI